MKNNSCRESAAVVSLAWALALGAFGPKLPVLLAGDFWKDRKPSEWSEPAARRMISQSPWAKQTKLQFDLGLPPGTPTRPELTQGTNPHLPAGAGGPGTPIPAPTIHYGAPIVLSGFGVGITRDGVTDPAIVGPPNDLPPQLDPAKAPPLAPTGAGAKPEGAPALAQEGTVIVLWESALPVREGKARLGVKDAAANRAAESFVVSVIGWPLTWDQSVAEPTKQWIRESAVLLRKGKKPMRASDVELIPIKGIMTLRFFFPRGKAIEASDKEVLFRLQQGPTMIQAKFNLKEMVYGGVLAL